MKKITQMLDEYIKNQENIVVNSKLDINKNEFTKYLMIQEGVSIHTIKVYFKTLEILEIAKIEKKILIINIEKLEEILKIERERLEGWF